MDLGEIKAMALDETASKRGQRLRHRLH
ncbi:hypothetical protein DFAR_3800004 [Desulfarculales bacterium]